MFEEIRKGLKRAQLEQNKQQGRLAEALYVFGERIKGNKVERTGRGHDFKVTERHFEPWEGYRKVRTKYVEVKSSRTARLSKLQQREKRRKGRRYEIDRPFF